MALEEQPSGTHFLKAENFEDDDEEMGAEGKAPKRQFAASTGTMTAQRRADLEREYKTANAAYLALRESRLNRGCFMTSYSIPVAKGYAKALMSRDKAWVEAVKQDPQGHGLGPKTQQVFPVVVQGAEAHLQKMVVKETVAETQQRMNAAIARLQEVNRAMAMPQDVAEYCTHASAKESHNGLVCVLEVVYTPDITAQEVRKVVDAVVKDLKGSKFVGPAPPGRAEREMKQVVEELRVLLGKPKRGAKNDA